MRQPPRHRSRLAGGPRLPLGVARRATTSIAAKSLPEYSSSSARDSGAVVVLGNPAQCNKRVRIGPDPAPTIEVDHTLQLDDCLALDRIAVESRPAEAFEPLAAATSS